jgi:hypothetical protein
VEARIKIIHKAESGSSETSGDESEIGSHHFGDFIGRFWWIFWWNNLYKSVVYSFLDKILHQRHIFLWLRLFRVEANYNAMFHSLQSSLLRFYDYNIKETNDVNTNLKKTILSSTCNTMIYKHFQNQRKRLM